MSVNEIGIKTKKKFLMRLAITGIGVAGLIVATLIIFSSQRVWRYQIYVQTIADVPNSQFAIIFGGGMQDTGEQSVFQTDRVARGVELYKLGKAKKLIMTGDDGGNHDDEVHAMKLQAIKFGVPKDSIIVDTHGYRTYESCYRARAVYGVTSTIVVSQSFHLPRILYLCRGLGVEAVGVSADLRGYGWFGVKAEVREALARVKAWWQLEVTRPGPRSLEK
ncbi:MAG: ElyC/SanA/YdcF family protein [Candidatus Magasanikbacteria bacterium]|nr:ElyC/SanA/YdcF family protein [Candidatus Magasanikbacteria bacterium]